MLEILTLLAFLGIAACFFEQGHRSYCKIANVDKVRMIGLRHYEMVTIVICGINAWFVAPTQTLFVWGVFCVTAMNMAHVVRYCVMKERGWYYALFPITIWIVVSWYYHFLL